MRNVLQHMRHPDRYLLVYFCEALCIQGFDSWEDAMVHIQTASHQPHLKMSITACPLSMKSYHSMKPASTATSHCSQMLVACGSRCLWGENKAGKGACSHRLNYYGFRSGFCNMKQPGALLLPTPLDGMLVDCSPPPHPTL